MLTKKTDNSDWPIVTISSAFTEGEIAMDRYMEAYHWMRDNFKGDYRLAVLDINRGIAFRVEDTKEALLLKMKFG